MQKSMWKNDVISKKTKQNKNSHICLSCFLVYARNVNAQIRRQKPICHISCDAVNTEFMWQLFTSCLSDFPITHGNMADSNNASWTEQTLTSRLIECHYCRPFSVSNVVRCHGDYLVLFPACKLTSSSSTYYYDHVMAGCLCLHLLTKLTWFIHFNNHTSFTFFCCCFELSEDLHHTEMERCLLWQSVLQQDWSLRKNIHLYFRQPRCLNKNQDFPTYQLETISICLNMELWKLNLN